MANPLVVEEIDVPVYWVDYYIETVLWMIIFFVTVQHLIIVTLNLVNPENLRVAFDFLGVGVLGDRHEILV